MLGRLLVCRRPCQLSQSRSNRIRYSSILLIGQDDHGFVRRFVGPSRSWYSSSLSSSSSSSLSNSTNPDANDKQSKSKKFLMNDDFISSLRKEFQQKADEISLSHYEVKNRTSRKELIQSTIPYLLRNFPSVQNSTRDLMNLENVQKSSFIHLYMEGISNFIQYLEECDSYPPFHNLCTILSKNGFHDIKVLQQHSRTKKYFAKYDKLNKALQHRYKQSYDAQNKIKAAQKQYHSNLQQVQKSNSSSNSMGLPESTNQNEDSYHSIVDSLSNLLPFLSSEETLQKTNVNHEDKSNLQTVVQEKQKSIQKYGKKVTNIQIEIDKIKKEMKYLNDSPNFTKDEYTLPLLSRKKFSQVNKFINETVANELSCLYSSYLQKCQVKLIEKLHVLKKLTDLSQPQTWFGKRQSYPKRKIIFHTGPTNSGKTYEALQQLKKAKHGLYLGPLRLLAAEIYENLIEHGIPTNLYTGQERKEMSNATHMAATVELAPVTLNGANHKYDVAVIDEIQMISDEFRGFAWTRALLGLKCNEIHVCGGAEARGIVENIAQVCGDDFEIEEYQRFTPLIVSEESFSNQPDHLGSYSKVQPGDCVIAFSRNDIFAIQREIENTTQYKCCVIYGSLPPQIRSEQAQRFNDPDSGYDILVASDAIGMGLNLHIRRIIFNSMYKSNGEKIVKLDASTIQQISGRAGRRNSPHSQGEVTCRNPLDMNHLRYCMDMVIPPIKKAGLLPTSDHIKQFASALKELNDSADTKTEDQKDKVDSESSQDQELHSILTKFTEMATLRVEYFLCRQTQIQVIAKNLRDMPLSLDEKYSLCMAPVNENCQRSLNILKNFALENKEGNFFTVDRMVPLSEPKSFRDLTALCNMHAEMDLLLWLRSRFEGAEHDNKSEKEFVMQLKDETIFLINCGLATADQLDLDHCYIEKDKRIRSSWNKESSGENGNHEHNLDDLMEG